MPINVRDEFEFLHERATNARDLGDFGLAALYEEIAARVLTHNPWFIKDALARGIILADRERD